MKNQIFRIHNSKYLEIPLATNFLIKHHTKRLENDLICLLFPFYLFVGWFNGEVREGRNFIFTKYLLL